MAGQGVALQSGTDYSDLAGCGVGGERRPQGVAIPSTGVWQARGQSSDSAAFIVPHQKEGRGNQAG